MNDRDIAKALDALNRKLEEVAADQKTIIEKLNRMRLVVDMVKLEQRAHAGSVLGSPDKGPDESGRSD